MKSDETIIFLLKILIFFAIVITLLLAGFIMSGGQGGNNFATFLMGAGVYLSIPAVFTGLLGLTARKKKDRQDDSKEE